MTAYEKHPLKSHFTLIKHNESATQVLTADLEGDLLHTMDKALLIICEKLFTYDDALNVFSDLVDQHCHLDEAQVDQWLTLRDVLSLHKHLGKNLEFESFALIQLAAQWIVHWPTNRENIFKAISRLQGLLTPAEQTIVNSCLDEYINVRNKLVNANLRLVAHIANRYREKGVDIEDLIQEGTLGVLQAVNRFNASLGNRFTTYAYWWIQQAIKQGLSDKRGAVRLPTNVSDRISKIQRYKTQYLKQFQKEPKLSELQLFSGIDRDVLESAQKMGNLGISLNAPLSNNEKEEHQDLLTTESHPVTRSLEEDSDQSLVETMLTALSSRQSMILHLYHGLGGRQEMTFKEIAPVIGVSLERTRQIYHEALDIIRESPMGRNNPFIE